MIRLSGIWLMFFLILFACTPKESPPTEGKAEVEEVIENYPNGQIRTKGQLRKGLKSGKWVSYYQNGIKWSEESYISGELNGPCAAYYPTGVLRYRGMNHSNEPNGKWYYYDEEGKVVREEVFE